MAQAIIVHQYGGPKVLHLEDITVGPPGPDEVQIIQTAIGVNFHDVYVRSGLYKTLALPGVPGCEAVGVVGETGAGVSGLQPGDRVGYVTGGYGAYASERLLPSSLAVKLPDQIDDQTAASTLLRALAVDMLVRRVHRIEPGMTILVHAAAGGVGRLLCQWASHLGANVIGTVGAPEKAETARAAGCSHTILYRETDFRDEVLSATQGRGAHVVYDSIGRDTFAGSLEVVAKCGHLVNFGQSSGTVEPVLMSSLAEKSVSISRPILFHYLEEPEQRRAMTESVFSAFADDVLQAETPHAFPMGEAAKAHAALEGRTVTKPMILVPDR